MLQLHCFCFIHTPSSIRLVDRQTGRQTGWNNTHIRFHMHTQGDIPLKWLDNKGRGMKMQLTGICQGASENSVNITVKAMKMNEMVTR